MTTTRRAVLLVLVALLVLLIPSKGISGWVADELQPELGIFSGNRPDNPYHRSLRDSLLGEHRYRTCQVVAIPAFRPEWAVYLVRQSSEPPKIVYKAMKKQVSGRPTLMLRMEFPNQSDEATQIKALSKINKEVECFSAPISDEMANLLSNVWIAMLLRVRYPKPNGRMGVDGIQYYV